MQSIKPILTELNTIILGNHETNKLALCCLIAGGHLLLEDIPGVGKTTMAQALAKLLGLSFQRVQFTSDLLPTDLLGVSIYDQRTQSFNFQKGPVFTSVLLADEVNRASPKTQSALLQAMEEKQVSIDNQNFELPQPFFVIATQNPLEQNGTFPLPESQLDRFLMRLSLGYPDEQAELQLLQNNRPYEIRDVNAQITSEDLLSLIGTVSKVHCSESIVRYLQRLLRSTRESQHFINGLSPRAGLQWLQAARAWASLDDRDYVIPEDLQAVAEPVALHRLHKLSERSPQTEFSELLRTTPVD